MGAELSGEYLSWGRLPRVTQRAMPFNWRHETLPLPDDGGSVLPYGMGRSYGDSCLNDGDTVLLTRGLDGLIEFNVERGEIECEAGLTLDALLNLIVPAGWFLPVTPGTSQVTVGGAIANDVHGKNHHRAGSFGHYLESFELLRSDGSRLQCSPGENANWFAATVGGLGLTGMITRARLRLQRLASPYIAVDTVRLEGVADYFALAEESDRSYEYTVAWIDCTARGSQLGRGLLMRGRHIGAAVAGAAPPAPRRRLSLPVDLPGAFLNPGTLRLGNFLYYHRQRHARVQQVQHYRSFFYPLDSIGQWNRLYGKRGFYQYQCVIPFAVSEAAVRALLELIADSGNGSFLAVLKNFGPMPAAGMLSFPRPGVTLALDFANRGEPTLRLFEQLDTIVRAAGGALYPAKDARMKGSDFRVFYPRHEEFRQYLDPRFSSSFWRRATDNNEGFDHA